MRTSGARTVTAFTARQMEERSFVSKFKIHSESPLKKKAGRGFRGYPIATVAFYGPDDTRASKVAVAIVPHEGVEASVLERWYSEEHDVRNDRSITSQVLDFIRQNGAKSVVITDGIIGC